MPVKLGFTIKALLSLAVAHRLVCRCGHYTNSQSLLTHPVSRFRTLVHSSLYAGPEIYAVEGFFFLLLLQPLLNDNGQRRGKKGKSEQKS